MNTLQAQNNEVRIRTKSGKIITRRATVTDWIASDGRQLSTAQVGKSIYGVVDRDFGGPIFGHKK